MGAVKKFGVKFADKEKARQWRKYLALPTQMLLYDKDEKVLGLAVRRKCLGPLSQWTWKTTGFTPFKKVCATRLRARHEEVGSTIPETPPRPDVWSTIPETPTRPDVGSSIPETPPRPQLPLMEAALVESSGSECHATTVTPPGSPARRDPYMAVCPAPPTCYAPSMAVCPGCSTGKPCPNYPPPRCYAPAPRYMPVTPPVSPRSLLLTIPPMCLTRRPAQDPPTIPQLSERYQELFELDSGSDSPSVEIVPK